MPTVKFTQTLVQNITSDGKRKRFQDTILKGLVLAVEPSGRKSWLVDYTRPNGKRTYYKIGSTSLFTVSQARERAREFLANVALGEDPVKKEREKKATSMTLRNLVDEYYAPWVVRNRKSGEYSLRVLRGSFGAWLDVVAANIGVVEIERWRLWRANSGTRAATLNRQTAVLKAVLNWAVKRDLLEASPLARLEQLPQIDSKTKIRYLSDEERARLISVLDEREEKLRRERDGYNEWLRNRRRDAIQDLRDVRFADHLKPLVLISLNTGIRRGALFSLIWEDVDLDNSVMTLRPETAKSGKLCYVPLNRLARGVFVDWRAQSKATSDSDLVFPSPRGGGRMDNCNKAWASVLKLAKIENFRWHDMRHDFASQLVMKGVDLNTVRELLGHADLKMTLRYAHLAPKVKMQAVELLE